MEAGDGITYTSLLTREEQVEVLNRLDFVLKNIIELQKEVEELKNSLQSLAGEISGEVKYTTANAESDYDRESERESEEGEDEVSCETVKTARRDSLDLVNEDETVLVFDSTVEEEFGQLLQQADQLHSGNNQEKREGFQLLHNNKLVYGDRQDFLWRLARAYSDLYEITEDADEKKSYASDGKEEAEAALQRGDQSAEGHQWYAILCGQFSEHESIQKRIQAGYVFKEHVDKAIALKPDDPKSYYLLGRWCYQAEKLSSGFSKAGRVYIAKVTSHFLHWNSSFCFLQSICLYNMACM
ncbi:Regulator of microtubule dynamics protein 3 [Chelonia mydas]|uniref:Regulator of microtubule dynamics protein 3 n=1 Tax=Chelonia mydas TaxID=8469 RepID=M7BF11_CHEMY|nr:Regulator of microtubule dynamics protein 3 [Chelonia mydas]